MKTIETVARVSSRGRLMASVPSDVTPGIHSVVLIITDSSSAPRKMASFTFPVDRVGKWPERLSLRREDIYGANGR